jgi:formate dehydrogenase accessory protein FdhE
VTISPWQRHIQRAQELAEQHTFAKEILEFYVHLARFQEDLHGRLNKLLPRSSGLNSSNHELSQNELSELVSRFESFLALAETHGPEQTVQQSRELRSRGESLWRELLIGSWSSHSRSDAAGILALAFLQPYAELLRSRYAPQTRVHTHLMCPFCNRKAGFGVLRQMGDGAARSLVCSFCLTEWQFPRLVCPGCGEQNDRKLPVFTAPEFEYIRVEGCESCKTYIKTIDLTKNGRAEPLVDEIAAVPLDLWTKEHGYSKLHLNLLGM